MKSSEPSVQLNQPSQAGTSLATEQSSFEAGPIQEKYSTKTIPVPTRSQLMTLQRTIGNSAVSKLLTGLKYHQELERSALTPKTGGEGFHSANQMQFATPRLTQTPSLQRELLSETEPEQNRFIVEDSQTPGSGQLVKTKFLQALNQELNNVAQEVLAGIGQTPKDCPYLRYWFSYYQNKPTTHIETALTKFAPQTVSATTWQEYLNLVSARVRQGFEKYVKTGAITPVPQELQEEVAQQEGLPEAGMGPEVGESDGQMVQRCLPKKEKGGGKGKLVQMPDDHLEPLWQEAEDRKVSGYLVRKIPAGDGLPARIIKQFGFNEVEGYRLFSGKPNFPTYYDSDKTYVVVSFIGNFPDCAEHCGGAHSSEEMLDQFAEICVTLSLAGVSHKDLDNNILLQEGVLKVIDFGGVFLGVDFNQAMRNNQHFVERLIAEKSYSAFREKLRVKCLENQQKYNPDL